MSKLINKILLIMSTILILFVVSFSAVFGYLFFQHSQNIESSRLESTALSLADILSKSTGNNPLTNIYNANVLQLVNILEQGEIWLVDKNTLQIVGSRFNPALTSVSSYHLLVPRTSLTINFLGDKPVFKNTTVELTGMLATVAYVVVVSSSSKRRLTPAPKLESTRASPLAGNDPDVN